MSKAAISSGLLNATSTIGTLPTTAPGKSSYMLLNIGLLLQIDFVYHHPFQYHQFLQDII